MGERFFQVRPADGSDSRFYSPNRDISQLILPALRRVFTWIDEHELPDWAVAFAAAAELSKDDLELAAAKVAAVFKHLRDPDAFHIDQAFDLEGGQPREAALLFVYGLLGAQLLGAGWRGLRQVTRRHSQEELETEGLLRTGQRVLERLYAKKVNDAPGGAPMADALPAPDPVTQPVPGSPGGRDDRPGVR